jgi:hypothetical protein
VQDAHHFARTRREHGHRGQEPDERGDREAGRDRSDAVEPGDDLDAFGIETYLFVRLT